MAHVDVIIPTLNRGYLKESLDSIQSQGVPVTVTVDATAGTGPYRLWEKNFHKTSGDYVMFFSDDDVLLPGALPRLVASLESDSAAAFAWCAGLRWTPGAAGEAPIIQAHGLSSTLWRRSVLNGLATRSGYVFPPWSYYCGDAYLFAKTTRSGGKGVFVPEPLVKYRVHGGQMTAWKPYPRMLIDMILSAPTVGYGPFYIAKHFIRQGNY